MNIIAAVWAAKRRAGERGAGSGVIYNLRNKAELFFSPLGLLSSHFSPDARDGVGQNSVVTTRRAGTARPGRSAFSER